MYERIWQLFAVRCATCGTLLMTTPLIGASELKLVEDHLRACGPRDPLPDRPTLCEVMRRVRVGIVDPA